MPELDGFQLAAMIRQHPRFQRTAIIFVSAVHLTDLDQLKGYEHGAVDYISVPVVAELLRAKVRVFADLHRKTRQLEALNSDLENRVLERTEELARKAELLLLLNMELVEKNQEMDAIIRTAPDIIFSRQADGSRDYISGRFYDYTGAAPGTADGFGWMDYVHPDDRDPAMGHWMHCVESGALYEAEYRMRSRDGSYRWFRARALPIRDEEGRILKWYGTCSDIHDSKLVEQSIRSSAAELEKNGRHENRGIAPPLDSPDDHAGPGAPADCPRFARRAGAGVGSRQDGFGSHAAAKGATGDRNLAAGQPPLWTALFNRCAPCRICCIRLCWTRSGCFRLFPGMWRGLPSAAALKLLLMFSRRISRDYPPR